MRALKRKLSLIMERIFPTTCLLSTLAAAGEYLVACQSFLAGLPAWRARVQTLTLDTLEVFSTTEDCSANLLVPSSDFCAEVAIASNQPNKYYQEESSHVFHLLAQTVRVLGTSHSFALAYIRIERYLFAETRKHSCERLITKYPMMD